MTRVGGAGEVARAAVAWVAVAGSLAVGVACFPYTVDDAFIVARFAHHLATGAGYVMNVGGAASDGVTGPLWLLPGFLSATLGFDPVQAAKLVGMACVALAVFVTVQRCGARSGGGVAAVVSALALATQPTLGSWAVGGLETGAATLAATALGLSAMPGARPPLAITMLAAAAVPWLRPELVPFAAVMLVHVWRSDPARGRRAIAAALCAGILVIVFRLSVFGHALPLSAAAKPATFGSGIEYLARAVAITTGVGGLALCALAARSRRRGDALLALALLVHLASIVASGGDWMPGFRLLAPILPIYAYLLGVGFTRLHRSRPQWRRITAWALLAPALALPVTDLWLRVDGAAETAKSRQTVGVRLAEQLRTHATRVAMVDVGFLAYRSGVEVVDLGGVTDPEIAKMPGGHLDKRIGESLLRRRAPDAVLLHSRTRPRVSAEQHLLAFDGYPVEQRVAAMPWVRGNFAVAAIHRYAPHYYYVLLLRDEGSQRASEEL